VTALLLAGRLTLWTAAGVAAGVVALGAWALTRRPLDTDIDALVNAAEPAPDYVPDEWTEEYKP
jgi:hypothetical protein